MNDWDLDYLDKVIAKLTIIRDITKEIKMTVDEVLAAIDAATNAIAARIQQLLSGVGNLTTAQQAAFQVEIDKLTALGKEEPPPQP